LPIIASIKDLSETIEGTQLLKVIYRSITRTTKATRRPKIQEEEQAPPKTSPLLGNNRRAISTAQTTTKSSTQRCSIWACRSATEDNQLSKARKPHNTVGRYSKVFNQSPISSDSSIEKARIRY
jgi:hypothetical protein